MTSYEISTELNASSALPVLLSSDAKFVIALYKNAVYRSADESLVLPGKKRLTLATRKRLAYLGFQRLDPLPPPHSQHLPPLDYHLFPGLKKTIEREASRAKDLSAPMYFNTYYKLRISFPWQQI
jgi:hypothetical protein